MPSELEPAPPPPNLGDDVYDIMSNTRGVLVEIQHHYLADPGGVIAYGAGDDYGIPCVPLARIRLAHTNGTGL